MYFFVLFSHTNNCICQITILQEENCDQLNRRKKSFSSFNNSNESEAFDQPDKRRSTSSKVMGLKQKTPSRGTSIPSVMSSIVCPQSSTSKTTTLSCVKVTPNSKSALSSVELSRLHENYCQKVICVFFTFYTYLTYT